MAGERKPQREEPAAAAARSPPPPGRPWLGLGQGCQSRCSCSSLKEPGRGWGALRRGEPTTGTAQHTRVKISSAQPSMRLGHNATSKGTLCILSAMGVAVRAAWVSPKPRTAQQGARRALQVRAEKLLESFGIGAKDLPTEG